MPLIPAMTLWIPVWCTDGVAAILSLLFIAMCIRARGASDSDRLADDYSPSPIQYTQEDANGFRLAADNWRAWHDNRTALLTRAILDGAVMQTELELLARERQERIDSLEKRIDELTIWEEVNEDEDWLEAETIGRIKAA